MAWNEPGGGNRDPWGGNGRDKGPPDLDEVVRKLTGKFGGLFGGRKSGGGGSGGGSSGPVSLGGRGVLFIVALALIGWALSGIYIVQEGTRGVVLRFGEYKATTLPGPHWRLPYPIEAHEIVDVETRYAKEIGYRSTGAGRGALRSVPEEALMLTQDENIVDVRVNVQYQVGDPEAFLFNVVNPEETLVQVAESAIRETVGKSSMDFVLTEGRADLVADVKVLSQAMLDSYGTGLIITNVNLQDVQPPDEVQDSFADAIKAREDEVRQRNEAEAYANEVLPRARGAAARQLEEAAAYREQVIAQAEGEAARFEQLYTEYAKAPEVTGRRLYLETMETVLGRTNKVLMDADGGNNVFYLPLDRLMRPNSGNDGAGTSPMSQIDEAAGRFLNGGVVESPSRTRDTSRTRGTR